jgi:hypothetical protein
VSEVEKIAIDPIEELVKAIGIVHGAFAEEQIRKILGNVQLKPPTTLDACLLDPTIVQKIPTGADDAEDVGRAVVKYITTYYNSLPLAGRDMYPCLLAVAHDHEARIVYGERKYGQRLKTNNGRDALMDANQELLDSLSYLMQAYLEHRQPTETAEEYLTFFLTAMRLAENVRRKLAERIKDKEGSSENNS